MSKSCSCRLCGTTVTLKEAFLTPGREQQGVLLEETSTCLEVSPGISTVT
jgi:hypothetical protein